MAGRPDRRVIGTAAAALLAAVYLVLAPPSRDLAAHLFDAQLFGRIGFAPWDTLWYAGHSPLAYSALFPALGSLVSPPVVAAVAAVGSAALLERLAHRHLGGAGRAVGGLLGAATAINLYTGRLDLAAGALPAVAAIVALDRGDRRATLGAGALMVLAALLSPLAALFGAIAAGGIGVGAAWEAVSPPAAAPGVTVALAGLIPAGALAAVFGQAGIEPFGLATLLPVLAVCAGALALLDGSRRRLRAVVTLTGLLTLAAWLVPSPLGANAARLGTFAAAGLGALAAADRGWRRPLAAVVLVPLLYIGWQAPVADVMATSSDRSVQAGYYRPVLNFLAARWARQGPFRIEIPFTASHWEALWVGRRFPLARGWERQLDEADNPLFYRPGLSAAGYHRWLIAEGVRYVALPDVPLDASARAEAEIIAGRPGFLRPVLRSPHWLIDAVVPARGLAAGPATVTGLLPAQVSLRVRRPGAVLVRVRFTPYWSVAGGPGCVGPGADGMTRVLARRAGRLALVIAFAPGRIGADGPRCTT